MTMQQDELGQDQSQLDDQQNIQAEPQPVTAADVARIVQQQLATMQSSFSTQIRGLQSGVDKRMETMQKATEQQAQAQQREAFIQQQLANIPEENRYWMESVLRAQATQQQPQVEQTIAGGQPATDNVAWAQVQQIARNAGVHPQDSRIDYAALADAALTDDQRQQRFLASLWAIKSAGTARRAARSAPQQAARQAASQTPTPPAAPQRPAGGGGSWEQDVDQFMRGDISRTDVQQRLRAKGQGEVADALENI